MSKVMSVVVSIPRNIVTNNIPITIQQDPRSFPIVDFGNLSPYLKEKTIQN
jgi:hypothetical protein